jgi:hypothetical protein
MAAHACSKFDLLLTQTKHWGLAAAILSPAGFLLILAAECFTAATKASM